MPASLGERVLRAGDGADASQGCFLVGLDVVAFGELEHRLNHEQRVAGPVVHLPHQQFAGAPVTLLFGDVPHLDDRADGLGRLVPDRTGREGHVVEAPILVDEDLLALLLVVLRKRAVDGALLQRKVRSVRPREVPSYRNNNRLSTVLLHRGRSATGRRQLRVESGLGRRATRSAGCSKCRSGGFYRSRRMTWRRDPALPVGSNPHRSKSETKPMNR